MFNIEGFMHHTKSGFILILVRVCHAGILLLSDGSMSAPQTGVQLLLSSTIIPTNPSNNNPNPRIEKTHCMLILSNSNLFHLQLIRAIRLFFRLFHKFIPYVYSRSLPRGKFLYRVEEGTDRVSSTRCQTLVSN